MNEATIPPSPNWYLNNILACSYDGTIAWGARNGIVVAKSSGDDKSLKYHIIKNAHKDRVSALAFTPSFEEISKNFLGSAGDDTIKIWNMDTLSVAHTYLLGHGKQTVAIAWSYKDPLLVYCLSADGSVLLWNISFDTVSIVSLGKVTATCLSSCPHDKNLVAVGSKSGLVYIVNFQGDGSIVYKLRGHDTEVVDLSWCPSDTNFISGSLNRDLLLASGGRDRSIFIWRAGRDGRYEMEITVPVNPLDSRRHRSKFSTSIGNWIAICWVEPKVIFASSSWGELISCDLSTITKQKPTWKLIHACHARGLFCIANVPQIQEDAVDDWRRRNSLTIWTTAQDRQVVSCSIKEDNVTVEYNIPTQGGYVYCVAACPLDTSHLAFGVGDAMLRLWNLSDAHDTSFDITTLWQKIKGKIRTVSWHPEKESSLAFATEEGRIGVFDISGNKPPTLYRQYHRNTVYALGWGPSPQKKHYVLYSCGEGELVSHDPEKLNQDPTSIIKKECTDFSWKPDFSCLAVGFENGSISFFNRNLAKRGYANVNSKRVHCLVWHPESTSMDLKFSPFRHYLAVAFNSPAIIIFDLSNFVNTRLGDEEENENVKQEQDSHKLYHVVATLNRHVEKVVCLAWSPHLSGFLVSGSYDNTAQVWNIETKELMATYTGHCGPVLCCIWSPLHPDFIITGSADFTMRIWKIVCNDMSMPVENEPQKLPKKKKKKHNVSNKTNDVLIQNDPQNLNYMASEVSVPNASTAEQKAKVGTMTKAKEKKSERMMYFIKSNRAMNDKTVLLNSIQSIVKSTQSPDTDFQENGQNISLSTVLPLFSEKEDFMFFLSDEKSVHTDQGRHNIVTELDMWSDNLKQNLECAAKEKRLNDFLVSLAPSLSIKTWKEMCEVYAYQLVSEGNPNKAVSYLLCIHKNYKAIEVFENAHLHKEAYALARCKLDPDDPVLKNVLKNWASYCVDIGQFEQASHIYTKLGDLSNAIKYLARRKDAATLVTAAELAILLNDSTLSTFLVEQAITAALTNSEYDLGWSTIKRFPELKYREIHLHVLKELRSIIQRNIEFNKIETWLNGKSNYGILQTIENLCENCGLYYSDLQKNTFPHTFDNEENLWMAVSYEIAMAVTCDDKEQQLKHIVTALGIISQFEILNRRTFENQCGFLIQVIINLDARGPMDEKSIYAETNYPVSTSVRAYLCLALLTWIVDNKKQETINESMQVFVQLIEDLLEEVLNPRAIKQWSITQEINKLEIQQTSALCTTLKEDKNEDDDDTALVLEELNTLKTERKQFIDERISVPNPVIAYGKANELADKLSDENVKIKFLETLSNVWTSAIS